MRTRASPWRPHGFVYFCRYPSSLSLALSLDFGLFVISQSSHSTCPRPKWLQYCFSILLRGRHVRQIAPRITFRVYANDYPRRAFAVPPAFFHDSLLDSDMHALSPWQRISSFFPPPFPFFFSFFPLSCLSMELIFFLSKVTYDLASSIIIFFYFCVTSIILRFCIFCTFFRYYLICVTFVSKFWYFLIISKRSMRDIILCKKFIFHYWNNIQIIYRWFINLLLRYWSYGDQFFPLSTILEWTR